LKNILFHEIKTRWIEKNLGDFGERERIGTLSDKTETDAGLIRPIKRRMDPAVGPDAIIGLIPADLKYLVTFTQATKTVRVDMNFFGLYQAKHRSGGTLTLSGPFLGAPQAVMGMEKMIALGAKRFWVLGWCGSLQPDLRIGDLVIPFTSVSEEGTSGHYPIGDMIPTSDEELNRKIEKTLKQKGKSFRKGPIWTTDAPYRETRGKVKAYQGRGVLAVEMEMSALMTLASYRNVRLAGLLVVSDELFDMKWNPGFSNPKLKEASRSAGELLVGLVESLMENKNG